MKHRKRPAITINSVAPALLFITALTGTGLARAAAPSSCDLLRAPKAAFAMQVPFEVIDGRIYLEANVNGDGPFRFAVDTGASGLGRADSSLVSALGLEILKPAMNSDGVKSAEADTTHIRSLEIGGLVKQNLAVITRDYNSKMTPDAALSGIVGRDFFNDGLLKIDYAHTTLSFSRTLSLSPEQAGVLRYERPFRVPVSIGATLTEGNIDTGANVSFVLPRSLFEEVSGSPLQEAGVDLQPDDPLEPEPPGKVGVTWTFRLGLTRASP